jgi:hypothetical protein
MTDSANDLKDDLELLASGNWGDIVSIEELAKQTLNTLAMQKKELDRMRTVLFAEAAYVLRERGSDDVGERSEENLRLCAIRLSEAARVLVEPQNGKA